MRFLLDECLSPRLVPLLAQAGHDAVHVSACGLNGCPDAVVLAEAGREKRVLISADTDFGELLARSGAELPSLVLFRQGNRSPEHQAGILAANLDEVSRDLASGAIVIFTNESVRVRRLPIR